MTKDWLKDRLTGTKFYPITHEDAVIDNNGTMLSTKLGNKSDRIPIIDLTDNSNSDSN